MSSGDADPDLPEFPLEATLGDLTYRVREHYLGRGFERLYFGTRAHRPGERYLISVATGPFRPLGALERELAMRADGVFDVELVGGFDVIGVDPLRDAERRGHAAMVEKLPEGEPLPRLLAGGPPALRDALEFGLAIGEILERAAHRGVLPAGVRPEYVWARRDGERIAVTGLGGRNLEFFARLGRRDMVGIPLFQRRYAAPEVRRGEPATDRTLVFPLAVMIAEWATGRHPLPPVYATGTDAAPPEPRPLPDELAALLAAGMDDDRAKRPDLGAFRRALRRFA